MKTIYKNLYIIGNGFDLHHGIPSSYNDFKKFVKKNDHELYEIIEKYLPTYKQQKLSWENLDKYSEDSPIGEWLNTKALDLYVEDWSDLEEMLGNFDEDSLRDQSYSYLPDYGAEDWGEADNYAYQIEIEKVTQALSLTLKKIFTRWILQLKMPKLYDMAGKKLNINTNASFLNFNYTTTLSSIYGIPDENIVYIHNKAIDENSDLILGHAWKARSEEFLFTKESTPDDEPALLYGDRIIAQYFKDTFKSSRDVISIHEEYFHNLSDIENIFILGHSLSPVDMDYFREITKSIHLDQVKWKVSWFKQEEKEKKRQELIDLGVNDDLIKIMRLEEFNNNQLPLMEFDG